MKLVSYVPSLSRADGDLYQISSYGDGKLTCDCPAFSFGGRESATCKHIKIYLAAHAAVERCHAIHSDVKEGICEQCLVVLLATAARKVKREITEAKKEERANARAKSKKPKPE